MAISEHQGLLSSQLGDDLMKKILAMLLLPLAVMAAPKGGVVQQGSAKIHANGSKTHIETSHRAVVDWDSFSIGKGETVRFIQPKSSSLVINRVGSGASHIDGVLKGNGRIYLLNPNGVLVGKSGIISCAAFAASTLDFDTDACFKGGDLLFKGSSKEGILNLGKIEALDGDVILLARSIVNEGTLSAEKGTVALAAASEVWLKPSGVQRIYIAPKGEEDNQIENSGLIESAYAELRADGNVYRLAINQTGVVEATGIKEENGKIFLVAEGGKTQNTGALIAKSGTIHLLGGDVEVGDGAKIDVSGSSSGGSILVGGDFQGNNPEIPNARMTGVKKGATLCADCLSKGEGGEIILWGDELSSFRGEISARGGPEGGDGGFVEISSPRMLDFAGPVNLTADQGQWGTLLLDPSDVFIRTMPTNHMVSQGVNPLTFLPTAATADLRNTDLEAALNNANVIVTTKSNFSQAGDLSISASVNWAANTSLTLIADRDLLFGVFGESTIACTGNGSITMTCGRDFTMVPRRIETTSGAINIQAERNFSMDSESKEATIASVSGNISIDVKGSMTLVADGATSQILTDSGDILINQKSGYEGTDVTLGRSSNHDCFIESGSGKVLISCSRDLRVLGPSEANRISQIYTGSGPSRIEADTVLILSGDRDNSRALVGTVNGDLELSVVGDVIVKATDASGSHAHLGHYRRDGTETIGGGTLRLLDVGGDVQVLGAQTQEANAQIGASPLNGAGSWDFNGAVELLDVRGEIEVTAGRGAATIGFGVSASDDLYRGSVLIDAQKDVTLTAGEKDATIGLAPGSSNTLVGALETVRVVGQNILLNGGNPGNATIGFQSTGVAPNASVTISDLSLDALVSVILNPGTGGSGFEGSSLIGAFATTGNGAANVTIDSPLVRLNGSSGASGGYSRIISTGAGSISPTFVTINTDQFEVGLTGSNPNSAEVFAGGNLLVLSTGDVALGGASFVHTGSGSLQLVADYNPEDPLLIGAGDFSLLSGATLTSGGPLRIFTPLRRRMVVQAQVNGVTFVPGSVYMDSPTEQWGVAFPDTFNGFPFTFFYKASFNPFVFNKNNRIFAEMFQKLHAYDELLFGCKCFLFGYDKACYDQQFHPKGMGSSFDLFSEEVEYMLWQKYRNYQLKHVESF